MSEWYFRLKLDFSTVKLMPSGTRITQCENGVLITGKGYIRWVSNDFFDNVNTDEL